MKKNLKILLLLVVVSVLFGCSQTSGDSKTVMYSNADDEAIEIMKQTLDENGYKDKYEIVSYGSSELAAKMNLENVKTKTNDLSFSTFYLESLQNKYNLFKKHDVDVSNVVAEYQSDFYLPFLVNTGSIFYNENKLKELKLPVPKSIKDLAKPVYKGNISFPSLEDSTTGWLLVQTLLDNYSEKEAKQILEDIKKNAGVHIETSGSGPIKKIESGEVAIGFGLRHQAVEKQEKGLSIKIIDPKEGNYTLVEALAIISDDKQSKDIIKTIFEKGHEKMLEAYPSKLMKDDKVADSKINVKSYKDKLTAELLQEHIEFYNRED